MSRYSAIENLISDYSNCRSLRAPSLIITVYGDSIVPRGGAIWLGSLIRLLAPLGQNERLVRTSISRLAQDGWVAREQLGRRSYYHLTATGQRSFERAYEQIYHATPIDWDGYWTLALLMGVDTSHRDRLRKELSYLGFGGLGSEVLAHPRPPDARLDSALRDLGVHGQVVLMRAHTQDLPSSQSLGRLAHHCWQLDSLAEDYRNFLANFRPVWHEVANMDTNQLNPADCFAIRTLMIHEIRRLLLHDPQLPAGVLPEQWPGDAARLLCRNLYQAIQPAAEKHLRHVMETPVGPSAEPPPYFYGRFGGLLEAGS